MHVSARTYLTSGIGLLGVGAIALSPIQPLPDHLDTAAPQRAVESLAVNLAATIDPITPWVDTVTTTVANVQTLLNFYLQKPFPLLQTIGANIGTYIGELVNGDAGLISEQITHNNQAFFLEPFSPGSTVTLIAPWKPSQMTIPLGENLSNTDLAEADTTNPWSLNLLGVQTVTALAGEAPAPQFQGAWDLIGEHAPFWNMAESPISGQLLGLVGTLASPLISLSRSLTAVGQHLLTADFLDAIDDLINIPARMTNAFLNGVGFWDLTGVVTRLMNLPPFDPALKIGLNLGGLLNTTPVNGSLWNPGDPPTQYSGGTAFDALAVLDGPLIADQPAPGIPVGLQGSMIGLGQFLAEKLLVKRPDSAQAGVPEPAAAAEIPAADAPAVPEAPAPAPAVTDVPAHRGSGNDKSDNGSHGKGHRGAA